MAKRNRGASLTQLLAEATNDAPTDGLEVEAAPPKAPAAVPRLERHSEEGRGEAPAPSRTEAPRKEDSSDGHVRASDGSYTRADGERRVGLQLKMHPDDKRALKVQAAAKGLSPAEYVASLVRSDGS